MYDKFLIDYIAGVAGGFAVVLVGHPFDTTKTRLQTSPRGYYSGTLDCVRKTLSAEGVGGFYAGMHSPMLGQMFFRAASFSIFHITAHAIAANKNNHSDSTRLGNPHPSSRELMMAGGITGALISIIEVHTA
jgi:solute carrier family 25 carnitine/acylcarnitine transporter 20/29